MRTLSSALIIFFVTFLCSANAGERKPKNYELMDFGSHLNWTYQVSSDHIVYKGIAIQVDQGEGGIGQGRAWMVFDHDTLSMAAGWINSDGKGPAFINWKGVAFDGSHNSHASIVGDPIFINKAGPGYANPSNGEFTDPRYVSPVDKKKYGPIPSSWGHFTGLYRSQKQVVLSYTIGDAAVLEMPGYVEENKLFTRTFLIPQAKQKLVIRVAAPDVAVAVVANGGKSTVTLEKNADWWLATIPAADKPQHFQIVLGKEDKAVQSYAQKPVIPDVEKYKAGPRTWTEAITTTIEKGPEDGGFSSQLLSLPDQNPWNAWMRLGGFDFYPNGKRAAVCTWNGDVWLVDGVDGKVGDKLTWHRIATGLFQPLGLKIVNDTIYVSCRDQIARLHDSNGDMEIDYYENFNNDHQVTEHFHEFAMGLQTDKDGNFYYAKSARHAKVGLIPQHGTLMKVSADGSQSTIIARGFRAANGVCVNDDGSFYVTDQEGHWTPKNRINYVTPGGFYGNMNTLLVDNQSEDDKAMNQPLVWITNNWDRSPAELVRVNSPSWGALNGKLLNISYGTGKIFLVLQEQIGDVQQGGVIPLPIRFPTGNMRGRFHPNGDLYTCGLFGWAGSATTPGGFYRVHYAGDSQLPISLSATKKGIEVGFTQTLDPETATSVDSYEIKAWDLKRTSSYGSKHINERSLTIAGAELLSDKKTIRIKVQDLAPTWGMSIKIRVMTAAGEKLSCEIHNSIHVLKD